MKTPCLVLVMAGWFAFAGPTAGEVGTTSSRCIGTDHTAATQRALLNRNFSIHLKGVPFHDALEMLAAQAGVDLALDGRITAETLRRPLTLKLRKSSVYAVLHWIFRKHNLAWAVDGREIVVASPEFIDAGVRNRQIEFAEETQKKWRRQILPKLEARRMSVDVSSVPLARLLTVIAERAKLNLVWETDAETHRGRRVTLKIADATVREILDKLLTPAGLAWSLEAEAVVISPAG